MEIPPPKIWILERHAQRHFPGAGLGIDFTHINPEIKPAQGHALRRYAGKIVSYGVYLHKAKSQTLQMLKVTAVFSMVLAFSVPAFAQCSWPSFYGVPPTTSGNPPTGTFLWNGTLLDYLNLWPAYTGVGCKFTRSTDSSWIGLSDFRYPEGYDLSCIPGVTCPGSPGAVLQIAYALAPNTTSQARTGHIFLSGADQIFTVGVLQAAGSPPPPLCSPGVPISNVLLPSVAVAPLLDIKPWHITYGQLSLDFTQSSSFPDLCVSKSNTGHLGVYFNDAHVADSVASSEISVFRASSVDPMPTCAFSLVGGVSNGCLLNGSFGSGTHYAAWSTTGFSTIALPTVGSIPTPFGTGPLTFWIDLDALGVPPATTSMDNIVRSVEVYVHIKLINNLPSLASYTVIQDPGNVHLVVGTSDGLTTGTLPDGRNTTDIPQSFYYSSVTNPATVFPNSLNSGVYSVLLTGIGSGNYQLSVSSALGINVVSQQIFSGVIKSGSTLAFRVTANHTPSGVIQTILPVPYVAGDLNHNGQMDCPDLDIVKVTFGMRAGQRGFNAWADVNNDGVIDIRDLASISQKLPLGTVCQ